MLITTTTELRTTKQKSFDYILPISLPHIFKRFKFFPAVTSTSETEKWIKSGLTRTIFFEDGNTAKEELLVVNSPDHFAYKVTDFTSPLKFLIEQINGNWKFTELENNYTKIVWEYELVTKNKFASWIISIFLFKDLQTFCQNSMNIITQDLN
jgi:hypothetical protein